MFRSLLTPRWLLLHALFVIATVATGFLAVWQWDRAHEAGGSFQNLGYALQWPLFGVFTIFLWIRLMRMDVHGNQEEAEPESTAEPAPEDAVAAQLGDGPTTATRRKRPLVPPPAPPVDADEDPELAAYNQYLAELSERDRRAS
ncbi:hypothetical protein MOQ72_04480 [Saccharopolyspora sp. K220]|uniref:hypothetical protein n=1 Tax=Saccharopolyspora soli TaxID=2926618 RepID=UPI001F59DC9F|nr:hypothetical protein [Saccharopolyspora soli]MCI2416669.1 hypothetical protein [Saccharopolyspora soli]